MANIIMQNVPSGGNERPLANENDVILIDFDGRILYSYSKAEFAQLDALPTIPVLKYPWITQDGWNWTLTDAKAYVAKYGELVIGAQYTTADGKNVAYVDVPQTLSIKISIKIAYTGSSDNTITVDWGDGTTPTTESGIGSNVEKSYSHTFASTGRYAIKVSCSSPYYWFTASEPRGCFLAMTRRSNNNASAVAFAGGTADIIILSGASYTTGNMGQGRLTGAFIFPRGYSATFGNSNWFFGNRYVQLISWPKGMGNVLGGYNYQNCSSLIRISAPEGITAIENSAFLGCVSLTRFSIVDTISSIASKAFSECTALKELRFFPATPPTVAASDAFASLPTDCIIYVPAGKLTAYTTETNYPDPQTYTYREMSS